MRTILVTAYSVTPYRNKNHDTEWNWIFQIARFNHVYAITSMRNQKIIEKHMAEHPSRTYLNIRFFYHDLPRWLHLDGGKTHQYLWQLSIPHYVKKNKIKYDVAHHLSFEGLPTFLWKLEKPLVTGPLYPLRDLNQPFVKLSLQHSDLILSAQKETKLYEGKTMFFPIAGAHMPAESLTSKPSEGFTILSSGKLDADKGFDVLIKSFAKFYTMLNTTDKEHVCLKIMGIGSNIDVLKTLTKELGISEAVTFMGWLSAEKTEEAFRSASLFVLPSMVGGNRVVPEALSHGLPIVCLSTSEAGDLIDESCGMRIPTSNYKASLPFFADCMQILLKDRAKREEMSANSLKYFAAHYNWNIKGEMIRTIYARFPKTA